MVDVSINENVCVPTCFKWCMSVSVVQACTLATKQPCYHTYPYPHTGIGKGRYRIDMVMVVTITIAVGCYLPLMCITVRI